MTAETISAGGNFSPQDLERLVYLRNPVATNARDWQRDIDDFVERTHFKRPVILDTEPQAVATAEKLAGTVQDGDLVYVHSGDGGISDAAQFLGHPGAPTATALMASEAGDARNFRQATIDNRWNGQPSEAWKHSSISTVYPLRVSVEGLHTYTRLALTVAGAGAMAAGAEALDAHRDSRWRQNPHTRLAYQMLVSLTTLPKLQELELHDASGTPISALEIMAVNAPRIAKLFKFDTQVDEPEFLVGGIKSKHLREVVDSLRQMQKGTLPVKRLPANGPSVSFRLAETEANSHARIHFDGNAMELAPGSTVTIDQVSSQTSHRPISTIVAREALARSA